MNKPSVQESRAAFEKSYDETGILLERDANGLYTDAEASGAWDSWQAAIEWIAERM